MPLYDKSKAKDTGGFAQVREALTEFEGDVTEVVEGIYPPKLDDEGQPIPQKEYVDIFTVKNVILKSTEPLSMDITGKFNFRVSCSESKNSFWVDKFLASVDKAKLLMPDGLKGKRIVFVKATQVAKNPQFNYTSFIISSVKGEASVGANPTPASAQIQGAAPAIQGNAQPASTPVSSPSEDPMVVACDLAVGKTEQQFRSAVGLHPAFVNSPFLSLAKAGAITQSLVNEGKLKVVTMGNKQVYAKP